MRGLGRLFVLSVLVLPACSDDDATLGADGSTTAESDGAGSTSTGDATVSASSTTTTTATTTTTTDEGETEEDGGYEGDGGEATGCAFTCPTPTPNPGGPVNCPHFNFSCPEGSKCAVWANDGGPIPNAYRCSPVEPEPHLVGESCEWEGSVVSSIDTCESGSHCWGPAQHMELAVCRQICGANPDGPNCPDGTACVSVGLLPLCLDQCDPLQVDACGDYEACQPANGSFACSPVVAEEPAPPGDPCAFDVQCTPGTVCIDADELAGCFGDPGCCVELCEVGDPDGCPDPDSCAPFPGAPPISAYEGVGVCAY